MKDLRSKDVLSPFDFDRETVKHLFLEAEELRSRLREGRLRLAEGRILATVFLEPSTRTKMSFQMAMLKMEGVIDFQRDQLHSEGRRRCRYHEDNRWL